MMTAPLGNFERRLSTPALLLVARIAGAAIGIVTQIMLARTMPTAMLGLFYFATSLAVVLSVVAAAGYPQATSRFLTRYRAFARDTLYATFLDLARRDIAIIAVALAASVMVVALCFTDRNTAITVGLAAATLPVLALGQLLGAVANAERKFLLASLPELLLRPLGLLAAVAALWWLGVSLEAPVLLLTFLLLCLVVIIVQAVGLRRLNLPRRRNANIPRSRKTLWRSAAIPLVVLSLFTALFADVAILLVSPFVSRAELAVLAICLKISLLVGFAVQVLHQTALPAMAEELHRERHVMAMARANEANRVSVGLTLAATLVVLVSGDHLLAVFDPTFASAHGVLAILVASQMIRAMAGPASQMLTVLGHQKIVLIVCAIALALLGIANALLVPNYGLIGATAAILITISFWSITLAYMLLRLTGLKSFLDLGAGWRTVGAR